MNGMKSFKIKKQSFILTFVFFLVLSVIAFGFSVKTANAEVSVALNLYQPNTVMEYKELSSPDDACYRNGKIAVIDNNKLLVYKNGAYSEQQFTSLKQVKFFDDDYLIVSDNQGTPKYYKIAIDDLTQKEDLNIGGNDFDLNGDYLVSSYGTSIWLYERSSLTSGQDYGNKIDTNTPVCINGDGKIFFVSGGKLLYSTVNDMSTEIHVSDKSPSCILADADYVYYSVENKIYKKSLNGNNETELEINTTVYDKSKNPYTKYDLGKLFSVTAMSFKSGNLLVTDKRLNAVQEFEIDHEKNQLIFTGFAVAKGKTAFNRIGSSNKAIDRKGNTVAVLDDKKLTIITDTENGKEYRNVIASKTGIAPRYIALGDATFLLAENSNCFKIFDLKTQTVKISGNFGADITDVYFNDGKYYFLIKSGSNTSVYSLNENSDDATPKEIINPGPTTNTGDPVFTVDTDGNVYITDDFNDKVKKYSLKENGSYDASTTEINFSVSNFVVGIKELYVDLAGNLFALKEGNIYYRATDGSIEIYTPDVTTENKVTSMSMSFDKDQVYFICQNEETILSTTSLPNLTLADIEKTSDYKTKGESARVENLKIFTTNINAPVYSVTATDNGFDFIELIDGENKEFAIIYDYTIQGQTFSVLVGENNGKTVEVIVNKNNLTEKQNVLSSSKFSEVFIATDVNMYYLPIITLNDDYCLIKNGAPLRLSKKTRVSVEKTFNFLNVDYYYASADIDGEIYTGYIPVNFTVEMLSQDALKEKFTFEKLKATHVFSDEALTTAICEITETATVKYYGTENGVALIKYEKSDGTVVIGYVSADKLFTPPNTVIRNVLITLLVTLSVATTSVYFILRKKN